ncbi:MAG: PIN domain-containing protein [Acidobacteria bacterium]|nr:MAG: PIN domain-containing protein [Acidobacteriota bacterium]
MAELLDAVPDGSDILLDTNIIVYGLTGISLQCRSLLERCSREHVTGITLFEIVHEATHKFMIAEARQKAILSGQEEKGAKYLSKHPEQVKVLTDYWVNTLRLLDLNLLLLPTELATIRRAHTERLNAGLLTNDSIIVAAMREYGVVDIATSDRQFETVAGISVFAPTDLVAGNG